jgi:predicted nucleic acid-binding protein
VLLIDTGIFVSAADRNEPRHSDCATLLRNRSDLAVTASVIPEAAWLIETRLGPAAEARFLTLVAGSRFTIVDLTADLVVLVPGTRFELVRTSYMGF